MMILTKGKSASDLVFEEGQFVHVSHVHDVTIATRGHVPRIGNDPLHVTFSQGQTGVGPDFELTFGWGQHWRWQRIW